MTHYIRPIFAWGLLATIVGAWISFLVSFQAGVWLLFFAIVAWWVWQQTESGWLFFVVIAAILPMLKITQTIGTVTLIKDVIIITFFLKLFLIPLLTKKLPYRRNMYAAPIVALVIWTVVETVRANSLILGVLRARDIGLYVMLFLAVLYLQHDRRRMVERLRWFIASLVVVLSLAAYQWFFVQDSAVLRFEPVREIWIPRLSSILAHPSIFGEYLVMSFALMAGAFVVIRNIKKRILWGGLAVVLLPFIFLTYTRAAWLGLAAVIVSFGLALLVRTFAARAAPANIWKYIALSSVVALLLLLILFRLTPVGVFVRSSFDPSYGSNQERLEFMARLIGPLSNSEALFGMGLGDVIEQNFREVDLTAYDVAAGDARAVQLTKNRTLVDNQYLKTFIEMGLVGLLIYGWLYWRFFKAAWQALADHNSRITQVIGWWGVGFLAAFVVQALFIDIWDIFPTNATFWIVAALLSAAPNLARKKG